MEKNGGFFFSSKTNGWLVICDIKRSAERLWSDAKGEPSTAMAQFLRPNLGPTPAVARRVLEPIVAASALLALVVLIGLGTLSLSAFFIAAALCKRER